MDVVHQKNEGYKGDYMARYRGPSLRLSRKGEEKGQLSQNAIWKLLQECMV